MSLSKFYNSKQDRAQDIDLGPICTKVLAKLEHDVDFLGERLRGENRLRNIFRLMSGAYSRDADTLTYYLLSHRGEIYEPTHAGVGPAMAASDKKKTEYRDVRDSDAFKALHEFCARPENDVRIELVIGDRNRCMTGMHIQMETYLDLVVHLDQPYSASSRKLVQQDPAISATAPSLKASCTP